METMKVDVQSSNVSARVGRKPNGLYAKTKTIRLNPETGEPMAPQKPGRKAEKGMWVTRVDVDGRKYRRHTLTGETRELGQRGRKPGSGSTTSTFKYVEVPVTLPSGLMATTKVKVDAETGMLIPRKTRSLKSEVSSATV